MTKQSNNIVPYVGDSSMVDPEIRELVDMHRYMRPAGGKTEAQFCTRYLDTLPGVYTDAVGNRIGIIGTAPIVMWSSHTDTVHKFDGMQKLEWGDHVLSLHPKANKNANCLGADCTVGVWLMRQMYLAGKEGLYIWHADEECGGNGSTYISEKTPELLNGINYAIAFDRKGYDSVVTHQFFGRCASTRFAESLAAALGSEWKPDPGGMFTDTANYTTLVSECTNISVGYEDQHTPYETLNTAHATALLGKLLALDVEKLPAVRDPTHVEPRYNYSTDTNYTRFSALKYLKDETSPEVSDIIDVIWEYKTELAELLNDYGFTAEELVTQMDERREREQKYNRRCVSVYKS